MDGEVDLQWAFRWECPRCGAKNYTDAVMCEFSQEDQDAMREHYGIEFTTGSWESKPDEVRCIVCDRVYTVTPDVEPESSAAVDVGDGDSESWRGDIHRNWQPGESSLGEYDYLEPGEDIDDEWKDEWDA